MTAHPLPAGPQQDEFFKEISKVMNDAGVTLIERNTDKPVEVDGGGRAERSGDTTGPE